MDKYHEMVQLIKKASKAQIEWLSEEKDLEKYFFYDKRRTGCTGFTTEQFDGLVDLYTSMHGEVEKDVLIRVLNHLLLLVVGGGTIEGLHKWKELK